MGIKITPSPCNSCLTTPSEKPPHHMGIKMLQQSGNIQLFRSLKNLPTTWGLRRINSLNDICRNNSEKPPHHMGIKTVHWQQ